MTRLALLVRREALLHDFLVAASTEAPVFRDPSTHRLAPGIELSATSIALDFIGSPIIRTRARNMLATSQAFVLTAQAVAASGARARASTAVTLQPGQARIIELLCPARLSPASVIWSIMPL